MAKYLKKEETTVASGRLLVLITIVNRSKAEYYTDLIQSFEANMQVRILAQGTADAEILEYLALNGSEKTVIFSILKEERAQSCLRTLADKFKTIRDGKGVAYTIPMTSLIGVSLFKFLSNKRDPFSTEAK